jgi:hypothetical protein
VTLVVLFAGCRAQPAPATDSTAPPPAMPHADHRPHHGGLVLMNGDLHFEVVFDPAGGHRVYFSDEARADLPATYASQVKMVVTRNNAPPETLMLRVDEAGKSWVAAGAPITDPDTDIRVSYVARGKSYFIDLPYSHK